jgi:hypothetical protein
MEVDEFKSEARKLAWSRKVDDQNKLLLELVKTEETLKEEWMWAIFDALRSQQICPNISIDKLKFAHVLDKVTDKLLEHIRFTAGPERFLNIY